ncbi:MAG: hypothetical protein V4619_01365 [Bacteroidota bacterium]
MRNLIYLFVITVAFSSCRKLNEVPNTPSDINLADRKISKISLAPLLPVQQVDKSFYIGLSYEKNYNSADEVTLTFNGQTATALFKYTETTTSIQQNVQFLFKGFSHPIDGEITATIIHGNLVSEKKIPYKIVDNLSLPMVWNCLDKVYLKGLTNGMSMSTSGYFKVLTYDFINNPAVVAIGGFGAQFDNIPTGFFHIDFINSLRGRYICSYVGDQLVELKVIDHFSPADNKYLAGLFYDEMNSVYGTPQQTTANDILTSTFYYSGFKLVTTHQKTTIYTTITKL